MTSKLDMIATCLPANGRLEKKEKDLEPEVNMNIHSQGKACHP